jgi:serine/threonine protein kinase
MLGKYGEVVVLDWGLARVLDRPEELPEEELPVSRLDADGAETQPGQILGTPAYMAPEQALGKHDEIDALTDIYGLGRSCTGSSPASDRTAGAIRRSACGTRPRILPPTRAWRIPARRAR